MSEDHVPIHACVACLGKHLPGSWVGLNPVEDAYGLTIGAIMHLVTETGKRACEA